MISTLEYGAGPGTLVASAGTASLPDSRRRILVIEPHADDAILSVGGTMWLRRQQCAFIIATMASRSNHTRAWAHGGDFDIERVSALRCRESQLAADLLGGQHVALGLTDAALRYRDGNWSTEFYQRHRMSIEVCTSRVADDAERRRWTEAVRQLLNQQPTAEVWFPVGARHSDHMLTADACFAALSLQPALVQDRVVRLYQEFPYSARYPGEMQAALAALRRSGAVLEEEIVPVTQVRDAKRRLAAVYESQNIDEMWGTVALEPNELLWRVRELPRQIDGGGIVSHGITGAAAASATVAWIARNRETPQLRVLLTAPSGCWARDVQLLAAAFPRAHFEVYVASAASAEVVESSPQRVRLHTVRGGTVAWVLESLRLCFAASIPTLFHSGERRGREARLLSRLWPGSDALVVTSMDHFASALRIAAGDG
jgi:LmbE family N-acetylglucosaminyl deacetylase